MTKQELNYQRTLFSICLALLIVAPIRAEGVRTEGLFAEDVCSNHCNAQTNCNDECTDGNTNELTTCGAWGTCNTCGDPVFQSSEIIGKRLDGVGYSIFGGAYCEYHDIISLTYVDNCGSWYDCREDRYTFYTGYQNLQPDPDGYCCSVIGCWGQQYC